MAVMITVQAEDKCRVAKTSLRTVLRMGDIHLSNFLQPDEQDPPAAPLELCVGDESGLVQLRHTVDAHALYRNYWYRSGTNEAMANHLRALATDAATRVGLKRHDVVVDIGANDGTLLSAYAPEVMRVAFEPSNIQPTNVDHLVNDFFSLDNYPLPYRRAKLVTSIAMFYDVPDPVAFATDVADILHPDGLWVVEMHYLRDMIDLCGYDAICHEHLMYYDLNSFEYVVKRAGLEVVHVETNDVNGGSMRYYVAHIGSKHRDEVDLRLVNAVRQGELQEPVNFARFRVRVAKAQKQLRTMLENARDKGKLVLGYGASTKGATIMQTSGITADLMPAIADRNPAKWGTVTSGTRIPVISEDEARAMQPDFFVVFPYHFIDAFIDREQEFLARGGRFIIPVPTPHIL